MASEEELNNQVNLAEQLSSELADQLKNNKEIVKQLGIQEDIVRAISDLQGESSDTFQEYSDLMKGLIPGAQQLLGNINKRVQQEEKLKTIYKEQTQFIDNLKDKAETFWLTIKSAFMSWPVIILGVGSAILKIGGYIKGWAQDLKLSFGQMVNLSGEMATAGFNSVMLGVSLKSVNDATKGLVDEFGSLGLITSDVIENAAMMVDRFGVSGQEAAQLSAIFREVEMSTGKTADSSMKSLQHMAEINGIPVGRLMQDVAKNSAEFAKYSDGSADSLFKAAVQMNKLGLSLSDATKISDNLLDIDKSLAAEIEASALLGRQINMNKARELALAGDIEGAAKATLEQVGSIAEFNELNVYQRQALAEAAGMEVSQLQKALANQELINERTNEYASVFGSTLGPVVMGYADNMGKAAGFAFDNATNIGASLGLLGKMGGLLGKINVFQKIGAALANSKLIAKIREFAIDKLGLANAAKKAAIEKAGGLGGVAKMATGGAKIPMKTPMPKMPKTPGGGAAGFMKSLSKIPMGAVLKGAAAMVLVSAAVFVFGKAVQEFMKVSWSAVGMAVVSMLALVGAVALLGAIMMSGVGAVAIIAGAAAMVIVAGAMWILGKALQEIAKVEGVDLGGIAMQLLAFGGSMALLGILALPMMFAAAAIAVTAVALLPFAGAMKLLSGVNMTSQIEALSTMAGLAPGMLALSAALILSVPGLLGFSIGLGALAIGLAVLTPFLPTLMALHEMGMVGSAPNINTGGGNKASGGSENKENKDNKAMLNKLDALIDAVKAGQNIYIDGQRIAQVVASNSRTFEKTGGV